MCSLGICLLCLLSRRIKRESNGISEKLEEYLTKEEREETPEEKLEAYLAERREFKQRGML